MPRLRDHLPWRREKETKSAASSRASSHGSDEHPGVTEQVRPTAPVRQEPVQVQNVRPETNCAPAPAEPKQPVLQDPDPAAELPSIVEPESAARHESPAESQALSVTPLLWDKAYAKLKEGKPNLLTEYESLLKTELAAGTGELKKQQLSDIAARGLDRMSDKKAKYTIFGHEYVVKDQVAQVSRLLINLKSFISDAIKVSPEASLAWAGVCVILPLMTNPSTADEAQSSGFDYVTSRMRLYIGFEQLLWPTHTNIPQDVKEGLESSIEDLYVKILTFQITSVLRFYRGWLGQLGRDLVQYDDWKSMLEAVKTSETLVNSDVKKLQDTSMLRELEKMRVDADQQCASLNSLLSVAEMQLYVVRELLNEVKFARRIAEENQAPLSLPTIYQACYDSTEVDSLPRCLEGTRTSIKNRIESWVSDETADSLFWLNGPAGTGKSTVSRTIAELFRAQNKLAASYFFSRARQGRNELQLFFTTLASQIADHIPLYGSLLRKTLHGISSNAIASKSLAVQFDLLFAKVLQDPILRELQLPPQLIIIDALDELGQDYRLLELLKPLSNLHTVSTLRFCVFLTSRNSADIDEKFKDLAASDVSYQRLNLHQEYSDESKSDIETYLTRMFTEIRQKSIVPELWPDRADMDTILELATTPSPLFIYVSTLHRFLTTKGRGKTPRLQLKKWLLSSSHGVSQLSQIYLPVLQQAFQLTTEERRSGSFGPDALDGHRILTLVVLAAHGLSARVLAGLLDLEIDVVSGWLQSLQAVLDVPEDVSEPAKLLHKSFGDFLLDMDKPSDCFWIDSEAAHEFIALRCFSRMKYNGLKRDMCSLKSPGSFTADVDAHFIAERIPQDLEYATKFWSHHLHLSKRQANNLPDIHEFIRVRLLYWLEALALLESMPIAIKAMTALVATSFSGNESTEHLIQDAYRFVLSHSRTIQIAPLQAYASALFFTPPKSLVKQAFEAEAPKWAVAFSGMGPDWEPCLLTIEPPLPTRGRDTKAALSADKTKLAILLRSMIQIYDTTTWNILGKIDTMNRTYRCLSLSQDGRRLAAVLESSDTEIWDWTTETLLSSFQGPGKYSQQIISCKNDEKFAYFEYDTLHLLDPATHSVDTVSLSHLFLSNEFNEANDAMTFKRIMEVDTLKVIAGQCFRGHDEHDASVIISISSCGGLMARVRKDQLHVFNTETGQSLSTATLERHEEKGKTWKLHFFDGNRSLAHIAWDGQLSIWDVDPLALTKTTRLFETGPFDAVFLDDRKQMISFACAAGSISIWSLSQLTSTQDKDNRLELIDKEQHWASLSQLVTISSKKSLKVWNTKDARCLQTIHVQFEVQADESKETPSIQLAALSANSRRLVLADSNNVIRVWDVETASCLGMLEIPAYDSRLKAFSPDGNYIVLRAAYMKNTQVHIADISGQEGHWPLKEFTLEYSFRSGDFVFSDNGKFLATFVSTFVYVWNMENLSQEPMRFELGRPARSIAFSSTNQHLAAAATEGWFTIWDLEASGNATVLEIHEEPDLNVREFKIVFSQSGRHIGLCVDLGATFSSAHNPFQLNPHASDSYHVSTFGYETNTCLFKVADIADGEFEHQLSLDASRDVALWLNDQGAVHIQTAFGVVEFGPDIDKLSYVGFGMSEDKRWIMKGSDRMLFVPEAYRAHRPYIVDSVAILRHSTHTLLIHLKKDDL